MYYLVRKLMFAVTAVALVLGCQAGLKAQAFRKACGENCTHVNCMPNIAKYGYYQTQWRRWPGAFSSSGKMKSAGTNAAADSELPLVPDEAIPFTSKRKGQLGIEADVLPSPSEELTVPGPSDDAGSNSPTIEPLGPGTLSPLDDNPLDGPGDLDNFPTGDDLPGIDGPDNGGGSADDLLDDSLLEDELLESRNRLQRRSTQVQRATYRKYYPERDAQRVRRSGTGQAGANPLRRKMTPASYQPPRYEEEWDERSMPVVKAPTRKKHSGNPLRSY